MKILPFNYCSISTVLFLIVQVGRCDLSRMRSSRSPSSISSSSSSDSSINRSDDQNCGDASNYENCRLSSKILSKYEERLLKMNSHLENGLLYFITNELTCSPNGPDLYNQTKASLEYMTRINWKRILRNDTQCLLQTSTLFCNKCLQNTNKCNTSCFEGVESCSRHVANELGDSWKIALGSIQTAVRLLLSQDTYGCTKSKNITIDLIAWRAPFLDEQKDKSSCQLLPTTDCFSLKSLGKQSGGGRPQQTMTGQYLQGLKIKLDDIVKILSTYWPRLEDPSAPQQQQPPQSNKRSPDIYAETGSGSGQYYSNIETDDEDLLDNYGSGSEDGSGDDSDSDSDSNESRRNEDKPPNRTTLVPNPSSGGRSNMTLTSGHGPLCFLLLIQLLLLRLPLTTTTTIKLLD